MFATVNLKELCLLGTKHLYYIFNFPDGLVRGIQKWELFVNARLVFFLILESPLEFCSEVEEEETPWTILIVSLQNGTG
jgi:hypothetical protein